MPTVMDPAAARNDADSLRAWVATAYKNEPIVVLSNREPIRHDRGGDGRIVAARSTGGLVTALEPIVHACGGVWVAHGSGTADRDLVDRRDRLEVSDDDGAYTLRRVWLAEREEQGYYYGFANRGIWPLCHHAHVRPVFKSSDFHAYCAVNARFADAACDEARGEMPLILVQDYHLMLAPQMIRRRLPNATIIWFSHIPFPGPRQFAVCPWGTELLEGVLASTIAGFQTVEDCRNFIETARVAVGAHQIDGSDALMYRQRRTAIRAYPVSVEWPNRFAREWPSVPVCRANVLRALGCAADTSLIVGVDRLDYTKGIEEKCLAVERLLELRPEFRGHLVFAQVADPSRSSLAAYQRARASVIETAERINARFGRADYHPVLLLETHHEPAQVYELLRAADACYVGSLHDGMNLVAKEFVTARDDERGVLVLSRFAGAANELSAALLVNPYAVDECAGALARAIRMPAAEQTARMRLMRAVVAEHNSYKWAGLLLADAARCRMQAIHPAGHACAD